MKKTVKRVLSWILVLAMMLSMASCTTDVPITTTEPQTNDSSTETIIPTTTEPEPEPEPQFFNSLTGLECEERLVGKRPIAVMLNNIKVALPQSGLSKCDIIYEAEAEGGILRLCGLILDYENAGVLGSVRSARPYYVELALANDAIFVHAGGSSHGYEAISKYQVNDVDGVKNGPFNVDGTQIFWRDQDRIKRGVAYEHTMFTSGENVVKAAGAKNYRTTLNDPNFRAFNFAKKAERLGTAKSAVEITIPHSSYSTSMFRYNVNEQKYYHYQYGDAHVDGQDGQQVATENVFILYTNQSLYPGLPYRIVELTGEGRGYYCYGGEYKAITWKRSSATGTFSYFNEDGSELVVNPGRSYVSIANNTIYQSTTIV